MTKTKATLTTEAVTWSNDKPTKYQSFLDYPSEIRTVRLLGDPAPSKEKAIANLIKEINLWKKAIDAFQKLIEPYYENNN